MQVQGSGTLTKSKTRSINWAVGDDTITSGAHVIKADEYLRDNLVPFDQIFLEFKSALERLRMQEIESVHAFLDDQENVIWIIGNFISEEAQAAIYKTENYFLRKFQQFNADVHLIDREDRDARDIITTDVTTGAMDISYRLQYM